MAAREQALPEAFSLLTSEFNDFLCASIGEEQNHASLTLLSVLSRQGIDPWDLAAKLSRLPRATAKQRLTTIIEELPNGLWSSDECDTIAARLVALLPRRAAAPMRAPKRALRNHPKVSRVGMMLICAGLVAASVFLVTRSDPSTESEVAPTASVSDTPRK